MLRLFIFSCLLSLVLYIPSLATPEQTARTLEVGKSVEQEIKNGQTDNYEISLNKGDYFHLVVFQNQVDVSVSVIDPQHQKVLQGDSLNGVYGLEPIHFIADITGVYKIAIENLNQDQPAGKYEVTLVTQRASTSKDKEKVLAQQLYYEAVALNNQAEPSQNLEKAIDRFQLALKAYIKLADMERVAEIYKDLGNAYVAHKQLDLALEMFNKGIQLTQSGDNTVLVELYEDIADAYIRLGNREQSNISLTKALQIRIKLDQISSKVNNINYTKQINDYNLIGDNYGYLNKSTEALSSYQQALSLAEKIADNKSIMEQLDRIGTSYIGAGKPNKALEYFNRILILAKKLEDLDYQVKGFKGLGICAFKVGNYKTSAENLNKALQIAPNAPNSLGTLMNICLDVRDVCIALCRYEEALQTSQIYLNDKTLSLDAQALAISKIGYIYHLLGDTQKALEYSVKGLTLSAQGQNTNLKYILANLATAYIDVGEYQQALDIELKLLKVVDPNNSNERIEGLIGLSICYKGLGKNSEALYAINEGLSLAIKTNNIMAQGLLFYNLGYLYETGFKESKSAEDCYKLSLNNWRTLLNKSNQIQCLYRLAQLNYDKGLNKQALEYVQEASTDVEIVRKSLTPENRLIYATNNQNLYKLEITIMMKLHATDPKGSYNIQALEASEKLHSRTLVDLISQTKQSISSLIPEKLLKHQEELLDNINQKASDKLYLTLNNADATSIRNITAEIDSLTLEYQQISREIRKSDPKYAQLTQGDIIAASDIPALLDNDTVLLEYSLGEEKSYVWLISQAGITSYELGKQADIEPLAKQIYELQSEPKVKTENVGLATTGESKVKIYNDLAQELSQKLFQPLADKLTHKRLLIVGDGVLNYVSFAALGEPNESSYKPLIINHEVVMLPSVSTLAVIRKQEPQDTPNLLAIVADPIFDLNDERILAKPTNSVTNPVIAKVGEKRLLKLVSGTEAENSSANKIPRLPFTRNEAEGIFSVIDANASNSVKALDNKASKAYVLGANLARYKFVHFATHGYVDNEQPELSALILSLYDEKGKPQDGLLKSTDIFNLKLNADTVVLSACQTGLGKTIKGEGVVGLTRGFFYAGAKRVLVSLWSVNDKATSELMVKFYEKMFKNHLSPSAALRTAQIELYQSEKWSAPFYWAAFNLQGEYRN